MKNRLLSVALLAVTALGACSTSSLSYASEQEGYYMIRGRITSISNLSATKLTRLGDGVAVTVSQSGCKVTMQFANDETSEMQLEPGVIVVYGANTDYVLRTAPSMPGIPSK